MRQVLDQEYQKYLVRQRAEARQARFTSGGPLDLEDDTTNVVLGKENHTNHTTGKENPTNHLAMVSLAKVKDAGVKRDFFGRVIVNEARVATKEEVKAKSRRDAVEGNKIWVTYNEGFSNAVRKSVTLADVMRGL